MSAKAFESLRINKLLPKCHAFSECITWKSLHSEQTILIAIDAYLGIAKMVLISQLSMYFTAAGNIAN